MTGPHGEASRKGGKAKLFPAFLQRGEDVTLRVEDGAELDHLDIEWSPDSVGAGFEIQITDGGGQFLTVFKGTAIAGAERSYKFSRVKASEVKIMLTGTPGTIISVRGNGIKANQ